MQRPSETFKAWCVARKFTITDEPLVQQLAGELGRQIDDNWGYHGIIVLERECTDDETLRQIRLPSSPGVERSLLDVALACHVRVQHPLPSWYEGKTAQEIQDGLFKYYGVIDRLIRRGVRMAMVPSSLVPGCQG